MICRKINAKNINDYEKLIPLDDVYIVGHITDPADGTLLIGRNGEQLPLKAQGWNAFTENEQAK